MFKAFLKPLLNAILSLILGNLKSLLLRHIEKVNLENITNEEKRKAVLEAIKKDAIASGKTLGENILNLAIEAGVALVKDKVK